MQHKRIEGWVKRNDRRDVNLTATTYRADGSAVAVRISNLSYDGCQLEADHLFEVGECVTLALPGMGEINAQIRWVLPTGGQAGMRFLLEEAEPEKRRARFGS